MSQFHFQFICEILVLMSSGANGERSSCSVWRCEVSLNQGQCRSSQSHPLVINREQSAANEMASETARFSIYERSKHSALLLTTLTLLIEIDLWWCSRARAPHVFLGFMCHVILSAYAWICWEKCETLKTCVFLHHDNILRTIPYSYDTLNTVFLLYRESEKIWVL